MKVKFDLLIAVGALILFCSCQQKGNEGRQERLQSEQADTANDKRQIAGMLDSFNLAAANAEYEQYFNYFTEDAVFLGTDATEHWDKQSYMAWAKPFFDNKRTWRFRSMERYLYFGAHGDIAWFDELLDAPFAKICRGSGVVVKQNGAWKIQHYVLSMTIPNSVGDSIMHIKAPIEDSLLNKLKDQQSISH